MNKDRRISIAIILYTPKDNLEIFMNPLHSVHDRPNYTIRPGTTVKPESAFVSFVMPYPSNACPL